MDEKFSTIGSKIVGLDEDAIYIAKKWKDFSVMDLSRGGL